MDIQGSALSEHPGRLDTDDDSDSQSTTLPRIRKRDKIFAFNPFRSKPKAKPSKVPTPEKATAHRLSTVRTQGSVEIEHAVTSTAVSSPASNVHLMTIPTGSRVNIFSQNQNAPAVCVSLPIFGTRIETTLQLALCIGLLPKDSDTVNKNDEPPKDTFTNDAALLAWVKAAEQDPTEQERIRSLGARMVDEFAKDTSKDSIEIAEMVVLGPVLDKETYRRLLQSTIAAFDQSVLLKVDLLQGLVQLVQSAPAGSLVSDDLVKILSVLRIRLQGTHQQSLEHSFHLTLAVSRLLDVMAEHEVKDVDRVIEHEPLYGVLSGLKGSSDPYLMYQACYAFQALQYVPDNETPLQAVFRHSMGVVDGLVKTSTILKLDLGSVLEGLANLQQAFESAVETAGNVYEGVCSLIESGQGVLVSLKEGYGNGQRRPWYTAIRAANAFVQAGQLKDLNSLIYETSCRRDPLFQWGICQLLGEMVSDAIWDTTIRQKTVSLLGDLCQNDPEWGQDNSVKMWIHNIIGHLSTVDDEAVSTVAQNLLKDLHQDQVTTSEIPYPLRNRLPLPTKSPTLIRVLTIPDVESDLHRLKLQRLEAHRKDVYIPPLAKPGLKANDDDLFPLMEKVQDFLASKRQVMLVLGDSGSGKSTFNRHLENRLWIDYKRGGAIPLFINLPGIRAPEDDMIGKQLKSHSFSDEQILELKLHRQLIVICDGYDESQQQANLHHTNQLNRPGQWSTKMVISCRTQFLGPTYADRFKPQSEDRYTSGPQDLFQEAIIAPFSKEQIRNYVEQYCTHDPQTALLFHNPSLWSADEYMDKLTAIPNVMDLVKNPFLLTLALKALPGLAASNKDLTRVRITRAGLYDKFIDQWLETNRLRLQNNTLRNNEQEAFNALEDDDFIGCGIDYLRRLSAAIFEKQDGNPVVQYIHRQDKNSWKAAFFGTEPEVKLLRAASPLIRTGNQHRFVHRSVLEYFLSRVIFNPTRTNDEYDPQVEMASPATLVLDAANPLFQRNLLEEPSIIQFLCDRVNLHPDFRQQLRSCIDQSKIDASATVAATNAISILVRAGVPLHGADLRGVKIPRADLSGGQFDFAQLQGADLRGVNLAGSWLRQVDMSGAQMEGVRFGELPYIQLINSVIACNYSPDGKMLAICLSTNRIWKLGQNRSIMG
ncbi:hypothetical protein BGZ97_004367 [Linnemannia gamsii]|uniref:NACHT domain-containing protein n=1 Tax=Linnemannia gamsii TaxID=64522 RepID=A0A9P6RDK9_9FUNG|nr:hypothetical protein BGZ97_004367 [Linnemannia gamsii]